MQLMETGLLPRRPETREMMASEHQLEFGEEVQRETVIQPISWIRDQQSKPSCVGQAFAAGVDAHIPEGQPFCSAVDLWRDARRRQGNLEGVLEGTRAEYVIASLIERGWSPFKEGEDARDIDLDDDETGSLADEMFAHDKRQTNVTNYDISRNRVDQTIVALQRGYVVGGGWGLADKFFRPPPDTILDPSFMNTNTNGHEMRIVAYFADLRAFLLQNSWSPFWTWCVVNGVTYRGCCLISEESVEVAWDLDAVEIKLAA